MVVFPLRINPANWNFFFSQLIACGISLIFLRGDWIPEALTGSIKDHVPLSLNIVLGMAAITDFGNFICARCLSVHHWCDYDYAGPDGRAYKHPSTPVVVHAPALGQDSVAVLRQLGYSESTIEDMVARRVVTVPRVK